MIATIAAKPRDFDSYAEEYFLLTTETEINAFWKRMDEIVKNMSLKQKEYFFGQLKSSIEKDMVDLREIKSKILKAVKK